MLLDLQMPRLDGLHDVRQQLLRWLDGDDRAFQEAAFVAMGQSRDVRALPDLRRIADSARGAAIRAAAVAAIEAIQDAPPPPRQEEVVDLLNSLEERYGALEERVEKMEKSEPE